MSFRRAALPLAVMLLVLAGCYRQVSEPYQPVPAQESAPQQPVLPPDTTESEGPDESVPITIIPPTPTEEPAGEFQPLPFDSGQDTEEAGPIPFDSETGVEGQEVGEPTPLPQQPLQPVPAQASPTPTFTFTPQVITPQAPGGPIPLATFTPTEPADPTPPAGELPDTPTPLPDQTAGTCIYIVQPGDNLFRIGLNNNTTAAALRAENNLGSDLIQPGQELRIPGCIPDSTATTGTTGDTGVVQPQPVVSGIVHVVQPGETLGSIARRYNVTVEDLARVNNISNPNNITAGQQLQIP